MASDELFFFPARYGGHILGCVGRLLKKANTELPF